MDDRRFDTFVKRLAVSRDRRSFVKGLLGLGSAAIAGETLLNGGAEAARAPAHPTLIPPKCPGKQIPVDGECQCPSGYDECGPDCCRQGSAVCCDNACCHGTCHGDELCCESPATFCSSTGECCPQGTKCCPSAGCIPANRCCTDADCPSRSCDIGFCGSDNRCRYSFNCQGDQECCEDGDRCTVNICTDSGSCATGADCRGGPVEICCGPGHRCLDNGNCCQQNPSKCAPGQCGQIDDSCGGAIDCGKCPNGSVCLSDQTCCRQRTCIPGRICGLIDDGCGGVIDCGGCFIGSICRPEGFCCQPLTCRGHCGSFDDGCGTLIDCPEQCPAGQTCVENDCVKT